MAQADRGIGSLSVLVRGVSTLSTVPEILTFLYRTLQPLALARGA